MKFYEYRANKYAAVFKLFGKVIYQRAGSLNYLLGYLWWSE